MENKTNKATSPAEDRRGILGYIVELNAELCSSCGDCTIRCPQKIFKIVKGMVLIDANQVRYCNGCNECKKNCDTNAIVVRYPQS